MIILSTMLTSCQNGSNKIVEAKETEVTSTAMLTESTLKEANTMQTDEKIMQSTSSQTEGTTLITEKSNVEQTKMTIKTTTSLEQSVVQTQTETTIASSPKVAVTQTNKLSEHIEITATMENEIAELYIVPEVVFIFSHEYYTPNCFGFYITNEGLIKSFDFREISPDAYCYVGDIDVYNTLDDIGIDTDFDPVPKETLSELFELLLNIADDNKYNSYSADPYGFEANGKYGFFAARFSESNEIQIIPLGEYGDFNGENSDKNANELFNKLKLLFPDPHEYLY